jgi:hypothetical protein
LTSFCLGIAPGSWLRPKTNGASGVKTSLSDSMSGQDGTEQTLTPRHWCVAALGTRFASDARNRQPTLTAGLAVEGPAVLATPRYPVA